MTTKEAALHAWLNEPSDEDWCKDIFCHTCPLYIPDNCHIISSTQTRQQLRMRIKHILDQESSNGTTSAS